MARRTTNFKRFEATGSDEPLDSDEPVRLNRFIARAGYCSRRQADVLIFDGHVKVNGRVETNPATRVTSTDEVEVNGTVLSRVDLLYLLLNKRKDTITSTSDERGRKTVMDYLPRHFSDKGIFPVGRLDRNTEGCLILTNDGDLAHRLMHPSYTIPKIYKVQTKQPLRDEEIEQLRTGVELDDGVAAADKASRLTGSDFESAIEIHEGRNRQVRRMYESLGHEIVALERINYAGLTSRGLRKGKWRILSNREIKRLKRLVGLKDVASRR